MNIRRITHLFIIAAFTVTITACNNTKKLKTDITAEIVTDQKSSMKEVSNKQKVTELLASFNTGSEDALKYINPNKYIQHNLGAPDGVEGLRSLIAFLSASKPGVNIVRLIEDDNYVIAQTEYGYEIPTVGFDIFRFENGLAVEHWDNLQAIPEKNLSGRSMIDGETEIKTTGKDGLDSNKAVAEGFVTDILIGNKPEKLEYYFDGNNYIQHHPLIGDGLDGLKIGIERMAKMGLSFKYTKIHKILGEGNFVLVVSEGVMADKPTAFYDLFRVENGKIAEHWDVVETIPPATNHKNTNSKFGF